MKLVWKSDDEKNYVIRFTKKEIEILEYILRTDDSFNKNYEVSNISKTDYLFIQKESRTIIECIDYLKHCFVSEVISSVLRLEKIKKVKK